MTPNPHDRTSTWFFTGFASKKSGLEWWPTLHGITDNVYGGTVGVVSDSYLECGGRSAAVYSQASQTDGLAPPDTDLSPGPSHPAVNDGNQIAVSSTPTTIEPQPLVAPDDASATADPGGLDHTPRAPRLRLTDFLDVATLQEVQDSFTAITRLVTTIRDAQGNSVTAATDSHHRAMSDELLEQLLVHEAREDGVYEAPIVVEGQELGSITIEPAPPAADAGTADHTGSDRRAAEPVAAPSAAAPSPVDDGDYDRVQALADRLNIADDKREELLAAMRDAVGPNRAASVQFLYLLANSIARLCYDSYHSRQRVEELQVLYRVSTVLSGHRNLQVVLDTAVQSVAEVMKVKAVSIRLVKPSGDQELVPRAAYNLSDEYLNKGAIRLVDSSMFREALAGTVVYVEDMASDARVLYPSDAAREGLVSMLCVGMVYQNKKIGTLQLYSEDVRRFSNFEVHMVQAISQMLATAIETTRLDQQQRESQQLVRQLHLAADVQRRMLPGDVPRVSPFDISARYVPSYELGGDFYDFIDLGGHLGVAVGDVVGKGVAASLLMASVRASLRAYAQDVFDIDEIIARVNVALCRDTLDNEFATAWYGVLDPQTLRLTYCNAGQDPPLLVRDGQIHHLDTGGMIVGVDATQEYEMGIWELEPDDVLLLYTDGLTEAFNADHEKFGRHRIEEALLAAADRSAADVLNHVLWEMRRFTGLRRSLDDTTMVTVKVGREREHPEREGSYAD